MKKCIVINTESSIKLRHIIDVDSESTLEDIKNWYYELYNKIEGDSFIPCETSEEVEEVIYRYEPWRRKNNEDLD